MNVNKLKKYILDTFTWKIPGYNYVFPNYIRYFSRTKGLKDYRTNRLFSRSLHEDFFSYDLKIQFSSISCITEFPLLILDRKLWEECCDRNNNSNRDCKFFCLDYFFPYTNPGIVVEIDGSQHQGTKEYDQARDEYIYKQYGLITLRAEEYGNWKKNTDKEFLQKFQLYCNNYNSTEEYKIDNRDFIISFWEEEYSDELSLVINLERDFIREKEVKMTSASFRRYTKARLSSDPSCISKINKFMKFVDIDKKLVIL